MPNPKLETYKNKATGVVYDYTDADAQSKIPSGASSSNKMATASDVNAKVSWEFNAKTGVHNIMPYNYSQNSVSDHNITITVNDDRSLTAHKTGTPDGNCTILLVSTLHKKYLSQFIGKTIKVSGGSADIIFQWWTDSGMVFVDNGSGAEFTLTQAILDRTSWNIAVVVKSTADLTNDIVIKPLMYFADDPVTEFTSPSMTNGELTKQFGSALSFEVASSQSGNITLDSTSFAKVVGSILTYKIRFTVGSSDIGAYTQLLNVTIPNNVAVTQVSNEVVAVNISDLTTVLTSLGNSVENPDIFIFTTRQVISSGKIVSISGSVPICK